MLAYGEFGLLYSNDDDNDDLTLNRELSFKYLHSYEFVYAKWLYTDKYQIFFHFILHFNPFNLILKFMILKFELFTEIAIEVQKYLNTRIYEFNPPNKDENYQLRYYSYITNTTETDKAILREMFIPTKDEIRRNE